MPTEEFTRPAVAELPGSAARLVGRFVFGTGAGLALLGALLLTLAPRSLAPDLRMTLIGSLVLFAAACGASLRFSGRDARFPTRAALCGVAVGAMLIIGGVGVALDEGLRSPLLAFCSLIVCIVAAINGARCGVALGLVAAAEMGLLAWAEGSGRVSAATATGTPLAVALISQWLLLLCAALGGSLIARVLERYLHDSAERDRRFRGLLGIAGNWYWEQDEHFRFTYISDPGGEASGIAWSERINRAPWEVAGMGLSEEQMDEHRTDLEAHRPFHAVMARRRDARGRWRIVSSSGEPRFDANGVFRGYWGVARDVTDEVRAQHAFAASETRYRELFARSPSPLFLHRHGIVFDANDAAARLFGFDAPDAMNGFDIVTLFPVGATRERVVERIDRLERMAAGEALPVEDYQIRSVDGHALSVQATAVRIDTVGGPANLTIVFDITARLAAEAALRRSEALLSHIFTTSPDLISLTEMATGRFAMVNPAFTRVLGYSAEEVIGRSSAELGTWHRPKDRDALVAAIRERGTLDDMPATFVTKSGARVLMRVSAARFEIDGKDYLAFNARDVTESERTRQQHTAILERASIGIAFTRERRFVQANRYFERMFGWEPGTLIGQAGSVVWTDAAEYREIGELAGPLLAAGKPFEVERRMRRRDGSRFWCRLLAQAVDRGDPSLGGTIWIAEDVTERRRLDEALAAARDAAEAASQAKSAFLANTSHEIRTPLNGLLGLTRLAMQEDLAPARRQQYLAQILDSAQSLADIMSDVLDVSKIEAGKIALEDTPFDLRETLQAVHHAYASLAEVKGLLLRLSIAPELPATVRGDPLRVRQILSNFITNALKFTERGEVRIEAATASAGGAVRLAVTDTGPGVPPELEGRLFTPFSQGDSSITRRFGGTGLGLSICRELATLMGGKVGVESRPGHGSTFWAELPLPRAAAPAGAAASAEAGAAGEVARLHNARVLMAEDNPVNMLIAVALLEQWGVQVAQACDGRAAIDAVHAAARGGQPFDAVLMDVQMPRMGGYEAARELRRHYRAPDLPIIALTAAALVSERDEARDAGMDGFLTKPIDAAKLRGTLAGLIAKRGA